MATQEDADMQKVFSKIEDFLALRKSTGTMVTQYMARSHDVRNYINVVDRHTA